MLAAGAHFKCRLHQIFVLYSLPVYSVGDIIDTWVYRSGILDFQLSLATAVGLFKGVIGLRINIDRQPGRKTDCGIYDVLIWS